MAWEHPTGKKPESVVIVALGPSKKDYVADAGRHVPGHAADEVWVVNTALRWCKHDLAFVMDDMREFAHHFPEYGVEFEKADRPIITSCAYDVFPTALDYPLAEVITRTRQSYFNNSVPYILAYALLLGVKRVTLFGADYTYPGTQAREEGRGCTEFWIGFCAANGMQVEVASSSTLMDASIGTRFYGYLSQPIIEIGEQKKQIPPDNVCQYKAPGSTSAA